MPSRSVTSLCEDFRGPSDSDDGLGHERGDPGGAPPSPGGGVEKYGSRQYHRLVRIDQNVEHLLRLLRPDTGRRQSIQDTGSPGNKRWSAGWEQQSNLWKSPKTRAAATPRRARHPTMHHLDAASSSDGSDDGDELAASGSTGIPVGPVVSAPSSNHPTNESIPAEAPNRTPPQFVFTEATSHEDLGSRSLHLSSSNGMRGGRVRGKSGPRRAQTPIANRHHLMLPESLAVTVLEGVFLIASMGDVVIASLRASMQVYHTPIQPFELGWHVFASVVYVVFIASQFYTARLAGWKLLDDDPKAVAHLYLRKWFPFDLAVALPYDLFVASGSTLVFRIFQVLRVAKIVRTMTLFRTSNPLYERRFALLISLTWILVMHHFIACVHMIAKGRHDAFDDYIESLYWAVQTTTSVGYGDVAADTTAMRVLSIILMLIGSGFYGWFLGNISVYFMSQDHVEQRQKHLRQMCLSLMTRYDVPLSIQKEAFCIYPFIFGEGATSNYTEILELFPPYMQTKIGIQVRLKLLRGVPMFKQAEGFILEQLAERLTRLLLEPDTPVIEVGETGKEMFFISSGAVEVRVPVTADTTKQVAILRDGSWFGEIAILKETRRTAAVRTVTVCDLFMLTKEDFLDIFEMYPESQFERAIIEEVDRRLRAFKQRSLYTYHSGADNAEPTEAASVHTNQTDDAANAGPPTPPNPTGIIQNDTYNLDALYDSPPPPPDPQLG
ncbi:Potassium voltage-gated channel protein eag [Diplonema papillatum]|nr:Potassium voltage-gated channel protein eag [Diplonema papillatum]